ncbi:Domain of unknown function DUF927 [uncultured Caudovirales phage]|uniref:DUF927 domain-containing protein n=1 Tax=uncultured Caudovirales phage TaxID=2100421 RepID=A0A6J5KWZ6_9CAUD|nr:Domain of unknown function DUF927 [uncultured Caudovirales phage]
MGSSVLSSAREFATLVLPWEHDGAYFNIHWINKGRNGGTFWDGRSTQNIDEFIRTLGWLLKQADSKDLYVCMSAQAQTDVRTSKKGHTYNKAVRNGDNALALKSIFLDIDVKEGAYETTRDALLALKEFVTSQSMPQPSALVASGSGGFHVHWALDQALPPDDWQVLANALANAARASGLLFDSQCTVDRARVLRVPETFNYKTEPPNPVSLMFSGEACSLDDLRAVLGKYAQPITPKKLAHQHIAENDELGAGVGEARPIFIADVARACPFVARSLETGGAANPNPLWFLTASIASFCKDGSEAVHAMSSGHPGYKAEDTDAMFDRVQAKRLERDMGWPKCDKIASYGCAECATCPLKVQNKSPLNFIIREIATPVAANDAMGLGPLPDGFFRSVDGLVFKRIVDDTGATISIQISPYPIYEGWLSNSPWTLHMSTRTDVGRKTTIDIPCEVITAKDALPKFLGGKGYFAGDKQVKVLREFLLAWIQKLQQSKDSVLASAPFGWSVVDGKIEGFSFAGKVWMSGEDRPAVNPDPYLAYQYTPKGDLAPWLEMSKIICEQRRPALDIIIASAFGAPLVRFAGQTGVMLNTYSPESGIGKTTAMRTAQAVWGDPVKAMQGLDDTINSVLKKIGSINTLPLFWDEIKTEQQTTRFANLAFNLTNGREKSRLSSDSSFKASGSWQTMLISASNDSIIDPMIRANKSTTAGLYRCFEYAVPKSPNSGDHGKITRALGKLTDNFGHAGLAYAKFLGAEFVRVEAEIATLQDSLFTELNCHNEERFWLATIVCLLKGAEYANELGLTDIHIPDIKDFLVTTLSKMREEVKESNVDVQSDMSVSSVLAQFLNAMRQRHTLITNRIWTSKGKPAAGAIKVISNTDKIDGFYVQIGRDDKLIRFSSVAFSNWMAERGYSRHAFTKRLKDEFGLKMVNGKLGGGTDHVTAMEYLLELDLNDVKLKDFVE